MAKDVLFEIGLEELPARFIDHAEKQLLENTKDWLQKLRISFKEITSFSTPRRLAVLIKDVSEQQTTVEEEARGPALKIAKDEEGNWTKAAIGFTKGQGKSTDAIYTKEVKGTTYIFVKKRIEGKQTIDLLPGFKEVVLSLQFGKNMRWGMEQIRYARPIRWLVALYGEETIPFEIAHVKTGNITYGHRFLGKKISLSHPGDYESKLRDNFVITKGDERKELILHGIKEMESVENFTVPVDRDLLHEVCNLVEYPTVFKGSFDESFLQLPAEVLVTSMKEHQRYFPVTADDGSLLPYFIGVRNGDQRSMETVIRGNEKVLRARLADAQFFFDEDQKNNIDSCLQKLESVLFQEKLGTIGDKVKRITCIAKKIAAELKLDNETISLTERAASICKFDLVTNMVNEFTELQGVMGEKYALIFGEDEQVAKAIREHYLPDHANGDLPQTEIGAIVSIADKLDTIASCLSIGLRPTGSQDPYGLRRQAIGILRVLNEKRWDIRMEKLVDIPIHLLSELGIGQKQENELQEEIFDFLNQRAAYLFKEAAIEPDVIQAVLAAEIGIFPYTLEKARQLSKKRNDPEFKTVQEALVRVLNLAAKADGEKVDRTLFETSSELDLYEAYLQIKKQFQIADEENNAELALMQLGKLAEPIHAFFEHNMVMADHKSIRTNRLGLVNKIAKLILQYGDLTKIEWKQHF